MDLLLDSPLTIFLVASTIVVHVVAGYGVHRMIKKAAKAEEEEDGEA